MKINGLIYQLPKEIRILLIAFILMLNIGYFGGLLMVNNTTGMKAEGIESQFLGNEHDDKAMVMQFKKSENEILTLVHNHILSMSVLFFLFALVLSITSLNKKFKLFLMLEPFVSILLTFGGLYFLWLDIIWFKYVVILSGILMTACFSIGTLIILWQLTRGQTNEK